MALSHLESGGGELSDGEVKPKHCLYEVSVVGTKPALHGLQMAEVWMVVRKQVSLWCRAGVCTRSVSSRSQPAGQPEPDEDTRNGRSIPGQWQRKGQKVEFQWWRKLVKLRNRA